MRPAPSISSRRLLRETVRRRPSDAPSARPPRALPGAPSPGRAPVLRPRRGPIRLAASVRATSSDGLLLLDLAETRHCLLAPPHNPDTIYNAQLQYLAAAAASQLDAARFVCSRAGEWDERQLFVISVQDALGWQPIQIRDLLAFSGRLWWFDVTSGAFSVDKHDQEFFLSAVRAPNKAWIKLYSFCRYMLLQNGLFGTLHIVALKVHCTIVARLHSFFLFGLDCTGFGLPFPQIMC
jgi:hypothetical protein